MSDVYEYEEEQERLAMMQAMHKPIKQWINAPQNEQIRERVGGDYPLFWRDLSTWEPWRRVMKAYMRFQETGETVLEDNSTRRTNNEALPVPPSSTDVVPRKRRSRWGGSSGAPEQESSDARGGGSTTKRQRKSRWGASGGGTSVSNNSVSAVQNVARNAVFGALAGAGGAAGGGASSSSSAAAAIGMMKDKLQENAILQMRLKMVNDRLGTVVEDAKRKEGDPNRSPSPPPIYDSQGKRKNTREVRMREGLVKERADIMEDMMKLNPAFRPPEGFRKTRKTRKLYVPVKDYPTYNFIGLIIGPRGNTQKSMERETGCKIAIRGKGSVKPGSRGRSDGKPTEDEHDDLHVLVTGDDDAMLDKAEKLVAGLLTPIDDEKNQHKQKQLRELALINGTLRDDEFCHICGEKGHRQFECPNREKNFKAANVKCAICGASSHPTRDCPVKNGAAGGQAPQESAQLDAEYMNFMAELGEGNGAPSSAGGSGPPAPAPAPAPGPPPPPSAHFGSSAFAQPPPSRHIDHGVVRPNVGGSPTAAPTPPTAPPPALVAPPAPPTQIDHGVVRVGDIRVGDRNDRKPTQQPADAGGYSGGAYGGQQQQHQYYAPPPPSSGYGYSAPAAAPQYAYSQQQQYGYAQQQPQYGYGQQQYAAAPTNNPAAELPPPNDGGIQECEMET